jgi:transglutaminase-like putative cysteine protease
MFSTAGVLRFGKAAAVCGFAVAAGIPLFAMPAALSLRPGIRPGIEPLTMEQAVVRLKSEARQDWELVEAARALVARRMRYSRRNSLDPASKAFERGYGYCQQMSFALVALLRALGFEAQVVQAFRNRLADGRVTAHAWVRVSYDGTTKDIDTLHYDAAAGKITFQPLSRVTKMGRLFRLFAGWGSIGVNALRYYRTGKDC